MESNTNRKCQLIAVGWTLAIICVPGSPANYTRNEQFLVWPIRYKKERKKKKSPLFKVLFVLLVLQKPKTGSWKFYVINWKHTKGRRAKLRSLIWFLTQVTAADPRQWEGARGCSRVVLQRALRQTARVWQSPDRALVCASETGRTRERVRLPRRLCRGLQPAFISTVACDGIRQEGAAGN